MRLRPCILIALVVAAVAVAIALVPLTLPGPVGVSNADANFSRRVRDTLVSDPQLIADAMAALQRNRQVARATAQRRALATHGRTLRASDGLPVAGNPKGDVTIVEFFDYRCPYCKRALATVQKVLAEDSNVRLVLKEFPILGPQSVYASRAAVASRRQGKYLSFHEALFAHNGALGEAEVMSIARRTGLDPVRLQADMQDPEVDRIIGSGHALARALDITGTPAFVIGDEIVGGLADIASFRRLIAGARARCNTC
jgi:protein-disulfide isomerase